MSDFVSSGWSLFVAGATIISLIACLVLLAIASKRKVMANDNTTGHVWDEDLREMNNPLPRWWVWLFIITVVFSGIYLAMYPGLGSYAGGLKWSSANQHEAEVEKARLAMAPIYAKFVAMPAEALAKEPQAMAIGERLFANNCSTCHGSDGRGSKGFPNLTDGDWLWGGTLEAIKESIVKGRNGVMPPMAAAVGGAEDVRNLANYVLSLSNSPHNTVAAQLGKAKFGVCAACHGPEGKGNQALGAPDLTDKVWLHGWGEQAIIAAISNGINNLMPPQGARLTEEQMHVLGAYVWSLSQSATVAAK